MSIKPEKVIEWVKERGVSGASWVYGHGGNGYIDFRNGPKGISLVPVGGAENDALFVPVRVWQFIKRRLDVTPRSEPSMFKVT